MKKILCFSLLLLMTACSSAAIVPAPTISPTATNTLVPTPTITPTATPVPNGPCDSPLLPLATGNQWTYRVTTESGEAAYTLKTLERDDGRNIVIKVEFSDHKNNTTVVEPVVCMDGAVENFPLLVVEMILSDYVTGDFNTYHDTGIYAPSYQTLFENSWSMKWDVSYITEDGISLRNPIDDSALLVGLNAPVNLYFETDGTREAVTVPVGSHSQAVKVLHSFTIQVSVFQSSGVTTGLLTVNTTQWYEPYVGLVRAEADSASLHLYGLNEMDIPVPIISTIELVEFKHGE